MPECFLKRVLPFALTLLVGVAAASLFGFNLTPQRRWQRQWRGESRSRSALVIRSMPAPRAAKDGAAFCAGCSVRMRVMFGADGMVSGNEFQLSPSSYALIEEASAAVRSIEFTPATRRGRPMPVWADVTYSCDNQFEMSHAPAIAKCGLSLDQDSVRSVRGRPWRVAFAP